MTSAALYWPCLKRINARSIERLRKVEDPPVWPHMIQLIKSLILLTKLCIFGNRSESRWRWSVDELLTFSNNIKANVKSYLPSFSFHNCFPMLQSVSWPNRLTVNTQYQQYIKATHISLIWWCFHLTCQEKKILWVKLGNFACTQRINA